MMTLTPTPTRLGPPLERQSEGAMTVNPAFELTYGTYLSTSRGNWY